MSRKSTIIKNLQFFLLIPCSEKQYKNLQSLHYFNFLSLGCSREYNQPFGYLKSPGWPGRHPNNMDCSIVLRAPLNHTISLFFHAFSLEDSVQCSRDFLEVLRQCIYVCVCVSLSQNVMKDINRVDWSMIWTGISTYHIVKVLWWKILKYCSKRLNIHYTKFKVNEWIVLLSENLSLINSCWCYPISEQAG